MVKKPHSIFLFSFTFCILLYFPLFSTFHLFHHFPHSILSALSFQPQPSSGFTCSVFCSPSRHISRLFLVRTFCKTLVCQKIYSNCFLWHYQGFWRSVAWCFNPHVLFILFIKPYHYHTCVHFIAICSFFIKQHYYSLFLFLLGKKKKKPNHICTCMKMQRCIDLCIVSYVHEKKLAVF